MSNQQGRGTIAILLVVAAAIVVALFGVMRWNAKDALPALSGGSPGPAQTAEPQQSPGQREASIPAPPVSIPAAPPAVSAPPAGSATPGGSAAGPGNGASPAGSANVAVPVAPQTPVDPTAPSFDVVRIEPDGESVIAGRGVPGATIELLRDGQVHARVAADASGLFAFVPPPLPPGSHQVALQSIAPDGTRQRSRDSVSIVISEGRNTRPLVALTSPDRPTVLLSSPEPPDVKVAEAQAKPARPQNEANASGPSPASTTSVTPRESVKIVTVEAEDGGKLYVSGRAAPGATVRLYLNESFIAPGGVGGDGNVSFAIGRGVRPGDYRVRLDDVDPVSGSVKSRAEVGFHVPAPIVASPPSVVPPVTNPSQAVAAAKGAGSAPAASEQRQLPAASPGKESAAGRNAKAQIASAAPEGRDLGGRDLPPSAVLIPDVNTAIISRGDNLWRLSQRIYGQGLRYTEIYGANKGQIRNPDLIYPGQLFVLPADGASKPK